MTAVWLAGAENPAHHSLFKAAEADRVALNVGSWKRNYAADWSLRDDFMPEEWIAWSDSPATLEDLLEVTEIIGVPPTACVGPEEWDAHPEYMPIWNGDGTLPPTSVGSIGLVVTDAVFSDQKLNKRVLSAKKRDMKLGVITGSKDGLNRYDFVITSAWWSAQKHGETQLWDGQKMHRVNATTKMKFRNEHLEDIRALGVNEFDVLDDNPKAVALLALKSWMAYGDHMEGSKVVPIRESEVANDGSDEVVSSGSSGNALATRTERGRHVLPTMKVHEIHDPDTGSKTRSVGSTDDSLKQCDNCYLAPSCPQYEAGASCAYSIPVTIQTKDQLQKVMQAVLEIQTKRVMETRFAEEITGQELDDQVGKEMDRLFNLTEKMRNIMDNRDSVSIAIESKGDGGGGILSKLFGADVGQAAAQLDQPIDADDAIEVLDP